MILVFAEESLCHFLERKRGAIERVLGAKLPQACLEVLKASGIHETWKMLEVPGKKKEELEKETMRHFLSDEDLLLLDEPVSGATETLNLLSKKHEIVYLSKTEKLPRFLSKYGFPRGRIFTSPDAIFENYKKNKLIFTGVPGAKNFGVRSVGISQREDVGYDVVVEDISRVPHAVKLIK